MESIGKGLLGPRGRICGGNGGRGGSMVERGGSSSRESNNTYGEVGGVEKMSSTGSKFMVRGRVSRKNQKKLKFTVLCSRGEVKSSRDDFEVSKSLDGEILGVVIGESG
ncbi:hypothetical protein Tco_0680846 [Tanacetum coccineum]|uniref:Uncharacterized protein n=1 Tax=Tanacetum coccineum TaxID=301880 RepID=A0ABQ4XN94_9ASTR